jgi:hypothetical protein
MNKEEKIREFILATPESDLEDYSEKLYGSLKDMNEKENKFGLWFVVILLLYFLSKNSQMESVDIGLITLTDTSIISKLLPLLLGYLLFNMILLTSHKKDVMLALNLLSENKFNQEPVKRGDKSYTRSLLIKLFFPYAFSNSISNVVSEKASIGQAVVGLILLLPIIIIVLIPYVAYIMMIIDIYRNYTTDLLGWVSFLGSAWIFLIILFYLWLNKD